VALRKLPLLQLCSFYSITFFYSFISNNSIKYSKGKAIKPESESDDGEDGDDVFQCVITYSLLYSLTNVFA
jgi:hypothetical protein